MIRRQLLDYLLDHSDQYCSGEKLSRQFGVSRQSIWKHIQALTDAGYQIESLRKKGYRLIPASSLGNNGLAALVRRTPLVENGQYLATVGSTNAVIKAQAATWTTGVVVADEQTAGRGRLGRNWRSHKDSGLWFSLLLRPQIAPHLAAMLTQLAALAMQRAIVDVTAVSCQIKWPNDIHYNGQKLCGILTEMVSEMSAVEYVVIGIGVNVLAGAVPVEIGDQATSLQALSQRVVSRLALLECFFTQFTPLYDAFLTAGDLAGVTDALNQLSNVVGRPIWVIHNRDRRPAKALTINQNGELVVEQDGQTCALHYGEVSIRPQ